MPKQLEVMLKITRSHGIARRYFVVNGFDGALTMLGLISGFYMSGAELTVVINACLGAAIALGMSGLSSAYISETAEKRKELHELEKAMLAELNNSAYGQATRLLPLVIAAVNGLAPFVISLLILAPLWAASHWPGLAIAPLESGLAVAFALLFLLGVFLGRIGGVFWLWAGVRALLVAIFTAALIFAFTSF